jgi:hypothetical protein
MNLCRAQCLLPRKSYKPILFAAHINIPTAQQARSSTAHIAI